jgi:hypothetical protein
VSEKALDELEGPVMAFDVKRDWFETSISVYLRGAWHLVATQGVAGIDNSHSGGSIDRLEVLIEAAFGAQVVLIYPVDVLA